MGKKVSKSVFVAGARLGSSFYGADPGFTDWRQGMGWVVRFPADASKDEFERGEFDFVHLV
jgi:hypothetical protein